MPRLAFLASCLLFLPMQALGSTEYLLEGQISGGSSLFFSEAGVETIPRDPVGGFPVNYSARLVLGPEQEDWTLAFEVFDSDASAIHQVRELNQPVTPPEAVNEVQQTGTGSEIIYGAAQDLLRNFFQLAHDFIAGTGQWVWTQGCPICDLPLVTPNNSPAVVSLTALIPEPDALAIGILVVMLAIVLRISSRRSEYYSHSAAIRFLAERRRTTIPDSPSSNIVAVAGSGIGEPITNRAVPCVVPE